MEIHLSSSRRGVMISGADEGWPVLHLHGHGNSRLEGHLFEKAASSTGVRLISVDRGGYGLSSPFDGNILDTVQEISELMTQLGHDKFSVMGISAGSCYALACHLVHTDRVEKTASISTVAPNGIATNTLPRSVRFSQFSARRMTWLYRRLYRKQVEIQMNESRLIAFAKKNHSRLPAGDYALLTDPKFVQLYSAAVREGAVQGIEGAVADIKRFSSYWGFEISEIPAQNLTLWHGAEDRAFSQAEVLAQIIGCDHQFIIGEGHVSIATNHIDDILRSLLPD